MKKDYCSFKEPNTKLHTDLSANSATRRFVTICRYRAQICHWNASLNSDPLIARWKVCVSCRLQFLCVAYWRFPSYCLPAFFFFFRWWLVSTDLILMFRQTPLTRNFQGDQWFKIRMSYSSPRSHGASFAKDFSTDAPLDLKKSRYLVALIWGKTEKTSRRTRSSVATGLWGFFNGKRKSVTERKTAAFKFHGAFTHGRLFIVESYTTLFICRFVSGIKYVKNYLSIFMLHWSVSLPAD